MGKVLVVYDIRREVLPTAPSPMTTHLMDLMVCCCVVLLC